MSVEILMPALASEMTEAKILRWLKSEGDPIKIGDPLVEIETDKAVVEVESEGKGWLGKCQASEGQTVLVNTVIGTILDKKDSEMNSQVSLPDKRSEGEAMAGPDIREHSSLKERPGLGEAGVVQKKRVFASPLARRLARLQGLDLHQLSGSGPNGRIVKADIEEALAKRKTPKDRPALSSTDHLGAEFTFLPESTAIEHTAMRSTIAHRLTQSSQNVPHYFLTIDCSVDKLIALRKEINETEIYPVKVSLNDFFIRAAALALMKVPAANVAWTNSAILRFHQADIALAVSTGEGLYTPVVRSAEKKSLVQVARESDSLIAGARNGNLRPEHYKGGTFTLSNLGMYGIKSFTSIINPPQGAILSLGAAEPRPVVRNGQVEAATIMTVTLAVDHRCIDGVVGAEFLAVLKKLVEAPISIVMVETSATDT